MTRRPAILLLSLLVASCGGGDGSSSGPAADVSGKPAVAWLRDFTEARVEAQKTGKPIFVDFYADW